MANRWRSIALPAVALAFCAPQPAAGQVSEVYQYGISWNGIPAAEATVSVVEDGGLEPGTTRVRANMRTNAFVDLFWSLRAEGWAEVDTATLHLQHFEYDRHINGRPEATSVADEGDGWLTGRYARPGRYHLIEVGDAGVLDPMGGILRARRDLPPVGGSAVYEIFTGEARYRIELRRGPTESISVPAGHFTAARLEPAIWEAERNQRDARVRRITMWVSDSPPHALLRIRSDVFIGALYADLTDWSCMGCARTSP